MSIIKVASKKAKNGYTYKVTFKYKEYGVTTSYSKSGFATKKEAKEHESMVKAEIKEKGCIKKECTKTLDEVYQEFLKVGCNGYQENTIYETKVYYKRINAKLRVTPISRIDYPMLQEFFNNQEHKSLDTNKRIKKALNRVFKHALKTQYISTNPMDLVDVVGIDNKIERENILCPSDFITLVDALKDMDKFIYYAFAIAIEIGYYTGLRISEVIALNKSDVDLENDIIHVNKKLVYKGLKKDEFHTTHQMKSIKSNAIIPLAPPLKQSLIEWFKTNPYERIICDIEGFYINPANASTMIRKVAKPLSIDFHFHMLRHSFITNLVTNNIDVKTVQELARHSNINTTMSIYTHLQEEQKKNAINNVFSTNYSKNTLNLN